MSGPNRLALRHMTVMRVFSDGPAVSLNGSPTVSPTTAALWASEPFPPWAPSSMNFLALSQSPPELAMNRAKMMPVMMEPARILPQSVRAQENTYVQSRD